jgi:hypothetical protein
VAAIALDVGPFFNWMHMEGPFWDMDAFWEWMYEEVPLRWLLIPGRPASNIALYFPHSEHFGNLELSQCCVRCSSGRVLNHDIDLKGMSPWDYLYLGMPRDIPVDCP